MRAYTRPSEIYISKRSFVYISPQFIIIRASEKAGGISFLEKQLRIHPLRSNSNALIGCRTYPINFSCMYRSIWLMNLWQPIPKEILPDAESTQFIRFNTYTHESEFQFLRTHSREIIKIVIKIIQKHFTRKKTTRCIFALFVWRRKCLVILRM